VRQASCLVLALTLLAGCGGNGSGSGKALSKEEYASKSDAVCAKYNDEAKALPQPKNLSEFADFADKTLPILDNALSDLKDLKPPADEQSIAAQWIAQVELLRDDVQETRDKAEARDAQAVQTLAAKAEEHNARSNELATRLGMAVCNTG
jgi:hypothetical protein